MGEYYEYVWYDFSLDEEIIGEYKIHGGFNTDRLQRYVFEIRSVFKLKRAEDGADDIHMGSERFGLILVILNDSWIDSSEEEEDCKGLLPYYLSRARLRDDYGMPFDQIQTLALEALAFAKQTRNAYDDDDRSWKEIPVVIELDVVTVQREGETVGEAMGRAIRPESLFPLHLCSVCELTDSDHRDPGGVYDGEYKGFLKTLKRKSIRVAQGFAPVVCPVCLRASSAGDLMSSLPCDHVCHTLCVYQMLTQGLNDSCPTCAAPIPTHP